MAAKSKAKSRASASKKKRAPRGFRTTTIETNKTIAAQYRKAKNPDIAVRIVRHGRKPAEYFLDVKHLSHEKIEIIKKDQRWGQYIARTTKLKNGEIRELPLPYNNKKIEQFIRKAEKDPDKVNALKDEGDLFAFTVEGHRVQTTFKDIRSLQRLVEYYKNTGSKGARISIFRIKKREDWAERERSVSAIKRRRVKKEARRQKTTPLSDIRTYEKNRKNRYYEKVKATEAYKARRREHQANYRVRLRARRNRRKNSKGSGLRNRPVQRKPRS